MAKQETPQQQQSGVPRTHRIGLIGVFQNRGTTATKDQRFVNCFPESLKNSITDAKKMYLVKRSGTSVDTTVVGSSATARGCAYFDGHSYTVFGNQLYRDSSSIQTLNTSSGNVGFVEATGDTRYLFLADGTDGWVIETNGTVTRANPTYSVWTGTTALSTNAIRVPTVVNGYYYVVTTGGTTSGSQPTWPTTIGSTVVDGTVTWECAGQYGGFPSPHRTTPAYLDGYVFLAKDNTSEIYNCDLENPLGWGSGDFLQAEMYPDVLVGLSKQNNQVVAMGSYSTEFFYDAANAEGSPLARTEGAVQQFGCAGEHTIFQNEKFLLFVGQSETGGRSVWKVDGYQAKKVSIESIEKILNAEGSSISTATAFGCKTQGHFFYVVNLTSRTLVYDIDENMWSEWSTNSGGSHGRFPYIAGLDKGDGFFYLQHDTDGNLYKLSPDVYTDNGTSILMDVTTTKLDFETMNRKFMSLLTVVGDTTATSSQIGLRWSDDDYKTWSSFIYMDLVTRPYFNRLGSFRRRAFNLLYTDNYPLRLEAMEVEVAAGVS